MINNRFRGRSEHTLDVKGRLNFPSRFREVLRQSGSEMVMLVPWKSHLRVYPVNEWLETESKLLAEGPEQKDFIRFVVGGVIDSALDKQGRILIPNDIRSNLQLTKEVVLTGMLGWVEVWDKETLAAVDAATRDRFEEHEENLTKRGLFL